MFWGKAMGTDGLTGGGKIKISRCYIWNLVKKSSWIWRMVPVSTLWFEWRTWQKCRTKAIRSVFLLISKNHTEGWDQINNIVFTWRLCSAVLHVCYHAWPCSQQLYKSKSFHRASTCNLHCWHQLCLALYPNTHFAPDLSVSKPWGWNFSCALEYIDSNNSSKL